MLVTSKKTFAVEQVADQSQAKNQEQAELNRAFELKDDGLVEQAFDIFMGLAKLNNPVAQCEVGFMFYQGIGVPENDEDAFYWFKQSAGQGHGEACFQVGTFYELGIGVQQDYEMARSYYADAANKKHAAACYNLANLHSCGLGGPKDNPSALFWYEEANKYDDSIATEEINEIKQDREQEELDRAAEFIDNDQYAPAFAILKRLAIVKNNPQAQVAIGQMYYEGDGVTQNEQKAMYWLKKVVDRNDKDHSQFKAFLTLGYIYKHGDGGPRDALFHYKQAEELISGLKDGVESSDIEQLQNKIKKIECSLLKSDANTSSSTLNGGSSVDNDNPENWPSESSDSELTHGDLIAEESEKTKEEIYNCASSTHSEPIEAHQPVSGNEDGSSSESASTIENENWTSKSADEIDEENFLNIPYQQQSLSKDDIELLHALSLLEEESYPQAIPILEKLAHENNYAPAQLKLGHMYCNGDGVLEDDQKALFYFNAAAEGGNAEAWFEVGECYRIGIGVEADMDTANKYYTKAKELDKLVAKRIEEILQESDEVKLPGSIHETNPSIELSESETAPDLKSTIGDDPCESAATWLSIYTLSSIDKRIIHSILDDFTKNQIGIACAKIGRIYAEGNAIPQDYQEAIKWYKQAAVAGFSAAELINTLHKEMLTSALADLHKKDYVLAHQKVFFLVSEKNVEALYLLGLMHHNGHAVKQDYYEAMKCFRLAANEGNTDACYQLGCSYHAGIGVIPSEQEAMVWYNQALKAGHPQAAEQIRKLQQEMLIPALDDLQNKKYASAYDKFLVLASKKNPAAQFQLGLMHLHGLGMKKEDYDGAISHFINAWENGYSQAAFMVAEVYLAKAKASLLSSLSEDFNKAFDWIQKASDEKNGGEASYQIATVFKGKIPESKIPTYLKKAHNQGHPTAIHDIFSLGQKYRNKLIKSGEHLKLADELLAFAVSAKYPAAIEKKAALDKQISEMKKSPFF